VSNAAMTAWIGSVKALEQLDFDIIVNSHFEQRTKADLVLYRQYLEELQKTIPPDNYKNFSG
jgi:hypothetical protein